MNLKRTLFFALLIIASKLFAADVTAFIDRNPVQLNESFQLIFKAAGSVDDDPDFVPLTKDFEILNKSQSSSFNFINGQTSRSTTWILNLIAREEGDLIIPAIKFGDDASSAVNISVKKSIPKTNAGENPSSDLILELEVSDQKLVVQSQLIVTLRLLTAFNINAYEMTELSIDNFDMVIESLGKDRQFQTSRGNKNYLVLERRYAVFPQQTGELLLPAQIAEVQTGRSSNAFIYPFPGRSEVRRVRSNELKVTVTNAPADFNGDHWLPAKNLKLIEEWPVKNPAFIVGEPVTRTLTLIADGLTASQLPDFTDQKITGLKQYPDQAVLKNQITKGAITAIRQQKIALIPSQSGDLVLPEIRINWWNTETRQMASAIIPARNILVQSGQHKTQRVIEKPVSPVPEPAEIVTQKSSPAVLNVGDNLQSNIWFYISLSLFLLWLATLLFFRKAKTLGSSSATSPQQQQEKKSVNASLKEIKHACSKNDSKLARKALINWANSLNVGKKFHNLNDLATYFNKPLGSHIRNVNSVSYGLVSDAWQAGSLYQDCEKIQKQVTNNRKPGQSIENNLEVFRKYSTDR